MNNNISFRPKLEGSFRTRFYNVASEISSTSTVEDIEEIVSKEIKWVVEECPVNLQQRKKYRAIWMLFRDLIRASWSAKYIDGSLVMSLPDVNNLGGNETSLKAKKSYMRSWMSESRLERIAYGRDFILKMESTNASGHSILDLIANGNELCERLKNAKDGNISVFDAVKPYLQLVVEGEKDELSGFKISDIWRYFRYSWSTPYETTPGRTMQYLIRDAAHPMHAVMGLASLENCALQITCRDQYIGWETDRFLDDLRSQNSSSYAKEILSDIATLIDEGVDAIKYEEFCTKEDIDNPTETLISRLQSIAIESEAERMSNLRDLAEKGDSDDMSLQTSLTDATSDSLFRRKRSEQLAKLLTAKISISQILADDNFDNKWRKYIESPNGFTSIRNALLVQKNKHIGSSMLELNVCGAIPPYNEVLGGKLVALLATSPQVILDYKNRYENQASEIASKLKGEKVCKPADLVYVGTTSLYSVGSSQYNRLKIPAKALDSNFDITWKEIGKTFGFGTLHISKDTTSRLNEAVSQDGYSTINHVFGEGASPKMRLLRKAITELLETNESEASAFSKHAMSRIVYAAFTAENTREYLLGAENSPKFYFNENNAQIKTQKIIDYWRERWLQSRLNYTPIYERILSFNKHSFAISNELEEENIKLSQDMVDPDETVNDERNPSETLAFIRDFYRGSSAFADFVDEKRLKTIHITTTLDDAILNNIKKGRDIVLTGNPGDGKTHIIRMLAKKIEKLGLEPIIEIDASTKSEDELYHEWQEARNQKKPFVLAINAALLHSIAESKTEDYIQSARDQMVHAIKYSDESVSDAGVSVFDLSRRDVLVEKIIKKVFAKMATPQHFMSCKGCFIKDTCPVQKNRIEIIDDLFVNRITSILRRASLTGYHATLRDLQSLASFLLFGGKTCQELSSTAGNDDNDICNLLYTGKGKIFDAIRQSFDPAFVSHPQWDEMILSSSVPEEGWSESVVVSKESLHPTNDNYFYLRKRQFYFFHKDGQTLLDISTDDVSRFESFLKKEDKEKAKSILRLLNKLYGVMDEHKSLRVWSSHRYNNGPRQMLVSSGSISRKDFVIETPRLSSTMAMGIDYEAPYVKISLKSNKSISLKVDYDVYHMLLSTERGLPNLLIESEEVKRIWRFMDLLKSDTEDSTDDEIEMIISDLQGNKLITVNIDIENSSYNSIS